MNLKDFLASQGENVSRETFLALRIYQEELFKWQKAINLVSNTTLKDSEERHFLDSAQLLNFIPSSSQIIIDVGSGAGFPGLVLSLLQSCPVILVESDHRKSTFLNQVILKTQSSAKVICDRVEAITHLKADVITSRGFAPLRRLLELTFPLITTETTFLLLKGKNHLEEIEEAQKEWHFKITIHPSITDCQGRILEVKEVSTKVK
ncbi:MAG: 16S rRNA (guanine(527)-N(7))-methyltransferase RsmG [Caedibacter sp. 37-49]|nr:MAG: 16S rRNA (guanine(527)-N(7))-methyltransferase RsmG [Caedibacter sp. 37-49]